MADGLCSGDPVGNVIEKTIVKDYDNVIVCEKNDSVNGIVSENVKKFYLASDSDKLFNKLCGNNEDGTKHEGFLPCEDDCRKKRCVDRYDSSESSDSGVAVLSCTDCSGSSTASSDITDPGSPFSTASSHSEDSGSQPAKMPPTTTQTAHHPSWPWTAEEGLPIKRSLQEKTAFPKRLKSNEEDSSSTSKQSPPCLNNNNSNVNNNNNCNAHQVLINNNKISSKLLIDDIKTSPNDNNNKLINKHNNINNNNKLAKKFEQNMQQGKITEYFKSQVKVHLIKKSNNNTLPNLSLQKIKDIKNNTITINNNNNKLISLVDQQTQFNGIKPTINNVRTLSTNNNKKSTDNNNLKNRKLISQITVPRKILPAPSKLPDNIKLNNLTNFTPTVTLTAVTFPPNLTYLHTKIAKPPDTIIPATSRTTISAAAAATGTTPNATANGATTVAAAATTTNFFVPTQFATITTNDKLNTIPIRTSCLNVIQPVQKITTINNFNCVKLNATVVPIVKLNTLPSRLNGSTITATSTTTTVTSSSSSVTAATSTTIATTNNNLTLSVETALPTVLSTKTKLKDNINIINNSTTTNILQLTPKQYQNSETTLITTVVDNSGGRGAGFGGSSGSVGGGGGGVGCCGIVQNNNNNSNINKNNNSKCKIEIDQCRTSSNNNNNTENDNSKCRSGGHKIINEKSSSSSSSTSSTTSSSSSTTTDIASGISNHDNLKVCVSEIINVEQQKSPILSQPKTIRFPVNKKLFNNKDGNSKLNSTNNLISSSTRITNATITSSSTTATTTTKSTHSSDSGVCRWAECNAQFDTSGALLEHLQVKHVISQATQEQYMCLWLGCKVHGRTSCSRSWLERHVLAHAGTKPFRCIVDGCGQRFNSQLALERHVNGHFSAGDNHNGNTKKSTENSTTKLYKRNGKKIRFRRQPWSARMFDFFDSGIMEGLQHKLLTMTQNRTLGQMATAGDSVNVLSQIMAKRVEPDGKIKFLVKWQPADIIPDEWVTKEEYVLTKLVPIRSLKSSSKDAVKSSLFLQNSNNNVIINNCNNNNNNNTDHKREKHRRKPISKQT